MIGDPHEQNVRELGEQILEIVGAYDSVTVMTTLTFVAVSVAHHHINLDSKEKREKFIAAFEKTLRTAMGEHVN